MRIKSLENDTGAMSAYDVVLLNFLVRVCVSELRVNSGEVEYFQKDFRPYCKPHWYFLPSFTDYRHREKENYIENYTLTSKMIGPVLTTFCY